MGITPHLVLRGTTYYFRMAVPRHLVTKVGRAGQRSHSRAPPMHRRSDTLDLILFSDKLHDALQEAGLTTAKTFRALLSTES